MGHKTQQSDRLSVHRAPDFVGRLVKYCTQRHEVFWNWRNFIPRLHDEAGSTSWLDERTTSALRAHVVEPARRASSSSQLHRVNGVLRSCWLIRPIECLNVCMLCRCFVLAVALSVRLSHSATLSKRCMQWRLTCISQERHMHDGPHSRPDTHYTSKYRACACDLG